MDLTQLRLWPIKAIALQALTIEVLVVVKVKEDSQKILISIFRIVEFSQIKLKKCMARKQKNSSAVFLWEVCPVIICLLNIPIDSQVLFFLLLQLRPSLLDSQLNSQKPQVLQLLLGTSQNNQVRIAIEALNQLISKPKILTHTSTKCVVELLKLYTLVWKEVLLVMSNITLLSLSFKVVLISQLILMLVLIQLKGLQAKTKHIGTMKICGTIYGMNLKLLNSYLKLFNGAIRDVENTSLHTYILTQIHSFIHLLIITLLSSFIYFQYF